VWRRAGAYLIDTVLTVVVLVAVVSALDVELSPDPVNPGGWQYEGESSSLAVAGALPSIYLLLTSVVLQGLVGFTPGKLLTGIRLVGWDGRPPGLWRAFLHTLVLNLMLAFGALGLAVVGAFVAFNRFHRHPGDMLANTYVVDAWAQDRLMIRTAEGLRTGPPAIRREDVVATLGPEEATKILSPSVAGRPTDPVFDKERGTYVVWRPKQEQWLEFDQASQQWRVLQ
jgi:uncharacterized RDD family membrane protein YckC